MDHENDEIFAISELDLGTETCAEKNGNCDAYVFPHLELRLIDTRVTVNE